ncbi:YihY/virulence factor BrkB family protein [Gordonia sp. X0973]|uniref:YihY/virulence factor BrkB family protein n=1 Tax=Gordonia sp. X0973 TaxID=2742602 RepID=UPI001584259D|nr:YihY/virulence factor BrkB family protein [Gordonia sp. X0973]QKT07461.1 YihY/virulence factor BrkB family protein [Gordonia sp. X0973]
MTDSDDPTAAANPDDATAGRPRDGVLRRIPTLLWRTIVASWNDGIIGWSAQAAFWQALSFAPLLLGLLGSIGYFVGWFSPDMSTIIHDRILGFAERTFTDDVVNDLVGPTLDKMLSRGRAGVLSVSFIISLWAGSSAMSCYIAAITTAHRQQDVRNPVWQRIFALIVYIFFLAIAVVVLPLVAIGPSLLQRILPRSWSPAVATTINLAYFPLVGLVLIVVLTTLYHLALRHPLPWHRLLPGALLAGTVFWIATFVLRAYLTALTRSGYTYGALATPIAFLLFAFFLGFAIVLGAEFNATVESMWPASPSRTVAMRSWLDEQRAELTEEITDGIKAIPAKLATGPIRRRRNGRDEKDGDD